MKKLITFMITSVCVLILSACNHSQNSDIEELSETVTEGKAVQEEQTDITQDTSLIDDETDLILIGELPTVLATAEDINGNGGYLLIGEIAEADISLYCDNLAERNKAYIRYGKHFQTFEQNVWADATILPELDWTDWDGDGSMDLVIKYLRHEGTYFDGEASMPGLVCEEVVYQWDGGQWADIHFSSGGTMQISE